MSTFFCLVLIISITNGEWISTEWINIPYIVSIRDLINDIHFCGGSILSLSNNDNRGIILTAAHCMPSWYIGSGSAQIVIGCTTTECSDEFIDSPSRYIIDGYAYHPHWNISSGFENDLLLLRLSESISHINSTQILIESSINLIGNNDEILATGYGGKCSRNNCIGGSSTYQLEYVFTHYLSQNICDDEWGEWVIGLHDFCVLDNDKQDGIDTLCTGDSGSPMIFNEKQIGIVSWGDVFCDPNAPSVATYLPFYYNWIVQMANDDNIKPTTTTTTTTNTPTTITTTFIPVSTNTPTISPTIIDTNKPTKTTLESTKSRTTNNPSNIPTLKPTDIPTEFGETRSPTTLPTGIPTQLPTTNNPTQFPTIIPFLGTTTSTDIQSTNQIYTTTSNLSTTLTETKETVIDSSDSTMSLMGAILNNNNSHKLNGFELSMIISVLTIFVIIIICIILIIITKKHQTKIKKQVKYENVENEGKSTNVIDENDDQEEKEEKDDDDIDIPQIINTNINIIDNDEQDLMESTSSGSWTWNDPQQTVIPL